MLGFFLGVMIVTQAFQTAQIAPLNLSRSQARMAAA